MRSFVCLSVLALSSGGTAGDAPPADLELASLAVTDGIVGGIIGPRPRVRLAAGYDRIERGFRAVRRRETSGGSEVWVAELEPRQFRALLELAVDSGLTELPLEDPPGCWDVYGCARQIRLAYRELRWANGAPGGCVHRASSVLPSEEQLLRFGEVVERLEGVVDALPMRPGREEDVMHIPFLPDVRALDSYQSVMAHVLADPVRHRLDLERVGVSEPDQAGRSRVYLGWRGRSPWYETSEVAFQIETSGLVRCAHSPPRDIFDPFEPLETGTTLKEVVARLGTPDERDERKDGSLILTYREAPPHPRPGPARAFRLRFEDGRLSSP